MWCERTYNSLGTRCDFTRSASRRSVDRENVSCISATSCQRIVDCRHVGNPTLIELANFYDNEGHVVGEGTVTPRSYAVKDCPLHFRQRRRFVNQVFQTLHAEHVIETVKNFDESIREENQAVARLKINILRQLGRR